MSMVVPLMYSGESVESQSIVFATSSTVANLLVMTDFLKASFRSGELDFCISVSTGLAATALSMTLPS